jgi:hypothetical protein
VPTARISLAIGASARPSCFGIGGGSVLSDKSTPQVPRRHDAAGQRVEVWSEGAYVRLHIRGGYDPASALALLALIRAAAQHYACQHFLIDISGVVADGSTPSQFWIRTAAGKLLPSLRVAIVCREEFTGTLAPKHVIRLSGSSHKGGDCQRRFLRQVTLGFTLQPRGRRVSPF